MDGYVVKIVPDGNCLFRALSYGFFNDQEKHKKVRESIVRHVIQNWSGYEGFIVGDESHLVPLRSSSDYYRYMTKNGTHGGDVELTAAARIYKIRLVVYRSDSPVPSEYGIENSRQFSLLYTGDGDHGHYDFVCQSDSLCYRDPHLLEEDSNDLLPSVSSTEHVDRDMPLIDKSSKNFKAKNSKAGRPKSKFSEDQKRDQKNMHRREKYRIGKEKDNDNNNKEIRVVKEDILSKRKIEIRVRESKKQKLNKDNTNVVEDYACEANVIERMTSNDFQHDELQSVSSIDLEHNRFIIQQQPVINFSKTQANRLKGDISNNIHESLEPLDIGDMTVVCKHCQAVSFKNEPGRTPNNCCHGGKVELPPLTTYPKELEVLREGKDELSVHFRQFIRSYNDSFAFASFNCTVPEIGGHGPYIMKIVGDVSYMISTSLESNNSRARYGQIYIYDQETQVTLREDNARRENLLKKIGEIINERNPYAIHFKTLYERYNAGETRVVLNFVSLKTDDQRRYNAPTCGEMAALIVSTDGSVSKDVEVQVFPKNEKTLGYVPKSSHHVDPMTFPLLFPNGDLGWSFSLKHVVTNKTISPVQYYGHRLALRPNGEQNRLLRSGRLTQHYIIHAYLTVESQRLFFLRNNQKKLRVECYQGMTDHIENSAANTADEGRLGNMMILPSTFPGGPRYMQQEYQDAMAIARKIGKPDLFITMTCNPKWPEILRVLSNFPPNTTANDIPTIVCRVFNIRLQRMLKEINSGSVFGKIEGFVYTIEFQKRGLPHAHILMILNYQNKLLTAENIDCFISAEIPDKTKYPQLHKTLIAHMLHGPHTSKTACWNTEEKSCAKNFPKEFIQETKITGRGFPQYRRRDNSDELNFYKNRVNNRLVKVDNSMIVPHNPYLLVKYNSHINVEYCASIMSFKYIHKYIHKGVDRARIQIESEGDRCSRNDEIQNFIDTRYVSPMEAAWRLMELPIHGRSHAVTRLPVHLPGQQYATFEEGREADAVLNEKKWKTALTAWFELNVTDETARSITYADTPDSFVFNVAAKKWTRRKIACKIIGRMTSVSPRDSERFHLKLILGRATNATCFEDLRVVDGKMYDTFRDAAVAMGLTATNDEAFKIFDEAVSLLMPNRLRHFFVWYLIGEMPSDASELWHRYKDALSEDFKDNHDDRALSAIENLLQSEARSCNDFCLPSPEFFFDEIEECIGTDVPFEIKSNELIEQLNDDQRVVYNNILNCIICEQETRNTCIGKCFYIDGPGGTGKTFLYNAIYYKLRALGKKVACVAWTGIAAILLPGGTTSHRLFGLPLELPDEGTIFLDAAMKKKIINIDVIIWDECSMIPRRALELIDRTLQDIVGVRTPFGGKAIILGGDFRQVLPVVKRGGKIQILRETIKYSHLWNLFYKFSLKRNMRATKDDAVEFSKWLLDVGNGVIEKIVQTKELMSTDLINDLYPSTLSQDQLINRAILAPQNAEVNQVNARILERMSGDMLESRSIDYATFHGTDVADSILNEEATLRYPIEYLNTLTPTGLPPHRLKLKVGAIVMLLRNLSVSDGLCNGTRLIIRALHSRILIAELLTGEKKGQTVEIPRIKLDTKNDTDIPFVLHRRQFPVRLAFAMTINKSQGQSFEHIGLYIDRPIFGHGQLYVALSRCSSKNCIKIQLKGARNEINNIVYNEVLD